MDIRADNLLASITRASRNEPDSGIIRAVNHGLGRPEVIPLWVGEGDVPTPEAFCRPAVESLLKGETFYTWQRGIPELRDALARYHSRHCGKTFEMLAALPGIQFELPPGAFYLFFKVEGMTDPMKTVLRIIDEAGVGFAPGGTFGPGNDSFLRLCFLRDRARLAAALERFGTWRKTAQPS